MSAPGPKHRPSFLFRRARYPHEYVWLVFVSALDVMLTWVIILPQFGGSEANFMPGRIIARYGMVGAVIYKFALIVLVIFICEWVGRTRHELGRRLAQIGIGVTAVVVAYAFLLLMAHAIRPGPP